MVPRMVPKIIFSISKMPKSVLENEGGYSNKWPEGKKYLFLTPRSQYEVSDHDIREERSSDDPFQVSNLKFHGGSTCGQQALTKVTKIMKKRYLKQKHFLLKMTETARLILR